MGFRRFRTQCTTAPQHGLLEQGPSQIARDYSTNYKAAGGKVAEHSWFPGYSWQIIVPAPGQIDIIMTTKT